MNKELIELSRSGESQYIEFKTSFGKIDSLAPTVCAFANSGGGTIVVGMSNDGTVAGISPGKKTLDEIKNELSGLVSPSVSISITGVETEGKKIMLIDVAESPSKPYTCNGRIFVRVKDKTIVADGKAIKKIIDESKGIGSRWERRPALGMEKEDIDENELLGFITTVNQTRTLRHPIDSGLDIYGQLENFGCAGKAQLYNSAIVLFGKKPSRTLPQTRIRMVHFGDTAGNKIIDNRILEGNAFFAVSELLGFLHNHINISSEIPHAKLQRTEGPEYPTIAIREALMNALQHRDYESYDGGMSVSVYPERIEIWNTGSLPAGMTVEDLRKPHHSRPHNPDIANVFFLRGYVERIGSGTQRIIAAFKAARLPEPEWSTDSGGICVTFRLTAPKTFSLNERQIALLKSLKPGNKTSRKEYREKSAKTVTDRQANIDITDLVTHGYLAKKGSGKSTSYVRTGKVAVE